MSLMCWFPELTQRHRYEKAAFAGHPPAQQRVVRELPNRGWPERARRAVSARSCCTPATLGPARQSHGHRSHVPKLALASPKFFCCGPTKTAQQRAELVTTHCVRATPSHPLPCCCQQHGRGTTLGKCWHGHTLIIGRVDNVAVKFIQPGKYTLLSGSK